MHCILTSNNNNFGCSKTWKVWLCVCMASIDWRFAFSQSICAAMRLKKTPTGTGKDWPIDWEIDRRVRDTSSCVQWNPNLIFPSFTHLTVSLTPYGNSSQNITNCPNLRNLVIVLYLNDLVIWNTKVDINWKTCWPFCQYNTCQWRLRLSSSKMTKKAP